MKTPTTPPPYRHCWECGRQFQGPFYRIVETDRGVQHYVHAACVGPCIEDRFGWRAVPVDVAERATGGKP